VWNWEVCVGIRNNDVAWICGDDDYRIDWLLLVISSALLSVRKRGKRLSK
jgi:hypothetical protein